MVVVAVIVAVVRAVVVADGVDMGHFVLSPACCGHRPRQAVHILSFHRPPTPVPSSSPLDFSTLASRLDT